MTVDKKLWIHEKSLIYAYLRSFREGGGAQGSQRGWMISWNCLDMNKSVPWWLMITLRWLSKSDLKHILRNLKGKNNHPQTLYSVEMVSYLLFRHGNMYPDDEWSFPDQLSNTRHLIKKCPIFAYLQDFNSA